MSDATIAGLKMRSKDKKIKNQKRKTMKKYTIEDARNRIVAIENDGTIEQMDEALRLIFPKDDYRISTGMLLGIKKSRFFAARLLDNKYWDYLDKTDLPTQSVKDFLEWKPVRGEMVLVGQGEERIFLAEIKGALQPYVVVFSGYEKRYRDGLSFLTTLHSEMSQPPEPEPLIKVIVIVNGKEVDPLTMSEEAWNKIRTN